MSRRSGVVRVASVAAALALVTAACGSRAEEGSGSSDLDPAPTTTAAGGDSGGGPTDGPTFGELPAPCGPGDGSELDSDETGLVDGVMKIGVITDRKSTFVPGINEGVYYGTAAWASWCNDLGGIGGRQIELVEYDANIFSYRDAALAACDEVFALVGSMGIQDNLGAQEIIDCGLVEVAASTVNSKKTGADRVHEPLPNPAATYPSGAGRYFLEQFPEIADDAVYVITDVPIGHYQRSRHIAAYEQIGYEFKPNVNAQINEDNWRAIVLELQRSGVEYLSLTTSIEEGRNMLKAMADQGWMPTVFDLEANFYDSRLLEMAGDDADGIYVRTTAWPFEEADLNPATADLVRLLEDEVDSGPSLLAMHAFSAGLLFTTAVNALDESGAELTRDGVLVELADIHEWNGYGLHGPTDPGTPVPSECFIILKVVDGAYTRYYPEKPTDGEDGYACDPDARVPIDVDELVNYEPGATAG